MAAYMARPNRNITFCKLTGRWKVKIVRKSTEHFLGRFDTVEQARVARDAFDDPWKEALTKRAEAVDNDQMALNREAHEQWRAFLDSPEYLGLLARLDELVANKRRQMIESGLPESVVYAITAR